MIIANGKFSVLLFSLINIELKSKQLILCHNEGSNYNECLNLKYTHCINHTSYRKITFVITFMIKKTLRINCFFRRNGNYLIMKLIIVIWTYFSLQKLCARTTPVIKQCFYCLHRKKIIFLFSEILVLQNVCNCKL